VFVGSSEEDEQGASLFIFGVSLMVLLFGRLVEK
jgi:hypothetical protein